MRIPVAFVAFAASLSLLATTGCHNNHEMPAPKQLSPVTDSFFSVSLQTMPQSLRQMDPVKFTVLVSDDRGRPLSGGHVSAELTMPTMQMGKNSVVLSPTAPGLYSGMGRFTMDGAWIVVVTAKHGSDKTVRSFSVQVH